MSPMNAFAQQMADEKDAEHICSTFHEHVATEIYKVFLQRGGKLSLLRQAVSKVIDRNTTDLPMPPVPLAKEELHLEAVTLNSDVDAEPSAGSSQAVPWEFRFLEDGRDVLSVAEIPGDRASSWNGYRHFFSLNDVEVPYCLRGLVFQVFPWDHAAPAS